MSPVKQGLWADGVGCATPSLPISYLGSCHSHILLCRTGLRLLALGLSLSFCLGLRELKKVPSGICLVKLILCTARLCNREFFLTSSQRYGIIAVGSFSYNGENDDFLVPDPKCKPFGSIQLVLGSLACLPKGSLWNNQLNHLGNTREF